MKQTIKHGATIDFLTPAELERILQGRDKGHSGIFDLVVGNGFTQEPELMTNPPVRRLRVTRQGNGGEAIAVAAAAAGVAPAEIFMQNEGRLGLSIINRGASPCFLYLADLDDVQGSERSARPTIWLPAAGGKWDGTVSSCTWGGAVCAAGDGGATSLTVAEL